MTNKRKTSPLSDTEMLAVHTGRLNGQRELIDNTNATILREAKRTDDALAGVTELRTTVKQIQSAVMDEAKSRSDLQHRVYKLEGEAINAKARLDSLVSGQPTERQALTKAVRSCVAIVQFKGVVCAAKTGFASTESGLTWFRGFRSRESERHGTRPELYTCNVVLEAE